MANSTPLGRLNHALGSGIGKRSGSSLHYNLQAQCPVEDCSITHYTSYMALSNQAHSTQLQQCVPLPTQPGLGQSLQSMQGVVPHLPPMSASGAMQPNMGQSQKAVMAQNKRDFNEDWDRVEREDRRKKRKSRWGGDEKEKTFIPGMPTVLPANLTNDQEEAYLFQLQIEEISQKLRTGELGIPPNQEDRSPSPEPIYSSDGKRLNTREYRTRKKLEEERHNYITRIIKVNPDYKPPADYKPPVVRVSDKLMVPQEEYPDINFVGLLIGPRGNTLKALEKETGAKIIIRGKGSLKEGKVGRKDGQPLPGEDEPLHAYVTANNPESVMKAVQKINEIIRQGVEVPEGQNDLRRMQLRELALLNGTLRENDGPRCSNCGANDHKSWQCPDKPNVTNNVVCTNCGGAGHIARDCRQKRPGSGMPTTSVPGDKTRIDEEYMSLMTELGEGLPPKREEDRDFRDCDRRDFGRRFGTPNVFDNRGPTRALMAPPPRPEASGIQVSPAGPGGPSATAGPGGPGGLCGPNQPPSLLSQNVPPPWSSQPPPTQQQNQPNKHLSMLNMQTAPPPLNQPVPGPPSQGMPPGQPAQAMPPWASQQQQQPQQQPAQAIPLWASQQQQQHPHNLAFTGVPPLNLLQAPLPPPLTTQSVPTSQPNPMSWMQQQQQQQQQSNGPPPQMPSWQQSPPPMGVPPLAPIPSPHGPLPMLPWQQNYMGVSPTQQPNLPSQQQSDPGIDLNALAQAGLTSLLVAPPPS